MLEESAVMDRVKMITVIASILGACVFCGIGILFRRIDVFSKLDHPVIKRNPNASKDFGTIMILISLVCLFVVVVGMCFQ